MIKSWLLKGFLVIVIATAGCKERYDANLRPEQSNYLVVEGFLNANGVTTITLGRTVPLTDSAKIKPELNAQLTIEGENNSRSFVRETGNGVYVSDPLVFNVNQKYRLHIKTTSGGEYLSEFTDVKLTPAIDSVSWKQEDDGIQIYANTHDPKNSTRYYKWDYEETWEINSSYPNYLRYVGNGNVVYRDPSEPSKLFYCWGFNRSVSILLGSSARLADDVISLAPLTFVPDFSEKTSVRYSILVKQYSLDRKSYDFYRLMKSNTESLGSVFDPLPSELTGNITCVSNPDEKVIGFVTASTVSEKRIFIRRSQINSKYRPDCLSQLVPPIRDSIIFYYENGGLLPYMEAGRDGYYSSSEWCIDCTTRGTSEKPSFW